MIARNTRGPAALRELLRDEVLLAHGVPGQELDRESGFRRETLHVLPDLFAQGFDEPRQVEATDALTPQHARHRFRMSDGHQRSVQHYSIIATVHADDLVRVTFVPARFGRRTHGANSTAVDAARTRPVPACPIRKLSWSSFN